MNRKLVTKFSNFVLGNGFYIALTLCVALIVLSGYYLMGTVTPSITAPASGTADIIIPEVENSAPLVSKPIELPEPEILVPIVEEDSQSDALLDALTEDEENQDMEEALDEFLEPEEETLEPVELHYIWPADGYVSQYHSLEVLSYNQTMGDWRTHNGIDITADIGTAVMSIADGEVTAVLQDDMMGTTVVIAHQGGVESTYANLGEFPTVSLGDWVASGQIIAVVGNSALAERGNEPHLDFSMTENGTQVDPLDYITQE